MPNQPEYDLIHDYPYQTDVEEKFALEFLQQIKVPADIKAASEKLERSICPYSMGLKGNQVDVALAVREVLGLPFYPDNEDLRTKSRDLITNLVKNSADANEGKVNGEKIIRLFMQYKKQ